MRSTAHPSECGVPDVWRPLERRGGRTHAANGTPMRCGLAFRDPDREIRTEILGRDGELAELVDPTDGTVRHDGPFVMYGREWRIGSVRVTGSLMKITCVSTNQNVVEATPLYSHRA